MTYSDDEHIDYIIDRFDFERVRRYIKIEGNWGYNTNGDAYVPSENELKSHALEMIMRLLKEDGECEWVKSGGFTVRKCDDYVTLTYSVSEVDSAYINYKRTSYKKDRTNKERKEKLNEINEISS